MNLPDDDAVAAYNAYGRAVEWRNVRDEPMPAWVDLGARVQAAWIAAAAAVRERVER